jgi:hypothetical protein
LTVGMSHMTIARSLGSLMISVIRASIKVYNVIYLHPS